ncbi:hypothetical protein F5Y16DRAFT_115129 [Xylariaceae sp. FL0255]|nr:hypothetical protein F5Y16DRAFT_115129 [Xylariaceae sp. FL0255]
MESPAVTPTLSDSAPPSIGIPTSHGVETGELFTHSSAHKISKSSLPKQWISAPLRTGGSQSSHFSPSPLFNYDDDQDNEEGGTLLKERSSSPSISLLDRIATRETKSDGNISLPAVSWTQNNSRPQIALGLLNMEYISDWILGRQLAVRTPPVAEKAKASRWDCDVSEDEEDKFDIGNVQDTCPACLTPYEGAIDSMPFESILKLSYNDFSRQEWLIGKKYVLHETNDDFPEEGEVPLVEAMKFLNTVTDPPLPVPRVVAGWKENGKAITISEYVPDQSLYEIWWDLSNDSREDIARQVAGYVERWRGIELQWISSLTHGPVYHHENLFGFSSRGLGPFRSNDDFWEAIKHRLNRKQVDAAIIQVLQDHMPKSTPHVFTHGDLSCMNIKIRNGRVSLITGFERAAILPAWAENVAMHFCYCKEDEEWKGLLKRHMHIQYQAALDWWSLWTAVEDTPNTDTANMELLIDRCQRWEPRDMLQRSREQVAPNDEDGESQAYIREIHGHDDVRESIPGLKEQRPRWLLLNLSSRNAVESQAKEGQEEDGEKDKANEKEPKIDLRREGPRSRKPSLRPSALATDKDSESVVEHSQHELNAQAFRPQPLGPLSYPQSGTEDPMGKSIDEEKPDNNSSRLVKGLRPLSLGLYSRSADGDMRRKLRQETDENQEEEDEDAPRMRDENITKTLRSLSSIEEASPDEAAKDFRGRITPSQPIPSNRVVSKRSSLFGKRAPPGGALAAIVRGRSAENRARQHRRSRSEEQNTDANNVGNAQADASQGRRARPQSMWQPSVTPLSQSVSKLEETKLNETQGVEQE